MTFTRLFSCLVLSTTLAASPALATDYVTGTLGWFDLVDGESEAVQLGAEYRFAPIEYGFRPMIGANITNDGSLYGYGGFHWDVELIPNALFISPNFAAGVYGEGDGKDLGGAIEFRSGLELAYQFENQNRLGVAFNHVSNAGIYNKNPGAETLMMTYSIPTGQLF